MDDQVLLSRRVGPDGQFYDWDGNPVAPDAASASSSAPSSLGTPNGGGTPDVWGVTHTGPFYNNPSAYEPPTAQDRLFPQIFSSGNPPTGWFTLDDYYAAQNPRRAPSGDPNMPGSGGTWGDTVPSYQPLGLPVEFSSGAMLPSTNDYRLLPHGYNTPNFFQINGQIIDRSQIQKSMIDARERTATGLNSGYAAGYPIAFTVPGWSGGVSFYGYPGAINGWLGNGGGMSQST